MLRFWCFVVHAFLPSNPARRLSCPPVLLRAVSLAALWHLGMAPAIGAAPPTTSPTVIDVGIQPLGYPAAIISAVMERDAVMRRDLAARHLTVNFVPYKKGNDMVSLVGGNLLEAAILGDMPTIRTAVRTNVRVIGLVKQTYTSVVGNHMTTPAQLIGKRIGYSEGSSAHHTLLQALKSAGLSEKDVHLVPLEINEMPPALAEGRIEAFCGWEPATSLALARVAESRVLFKGRSSDYFIFSEEFLRSKPAAARIVAAGFLRTVRWLQDKPSHLEQAAAWAIRDSEAFSGKSSGLTVPQAAEIARQEILSIPSAPVIVRLPSKHPRLYDEFLFLKTLGKLPADSAPDRLRTAFESDILQQVIRQGRQLHLKEFSYRP